MNALEQQLDYPFGNALPETGSTLEVAPGIKWIRMGLPFALDHVNLWLLRDEMEDVARPGTTIQGWSVVDCCISQEDSKAQWESIFSTQLEGLPILRVIVTHMHPDHVGLAHWLCERWTTDRHVCRLWISATDYNTARLGSQGSTGFGGKATARFFASHGLKDASALEDIKGRTAYYPSLVPQVPESFCRLMDGKTFLIGGRSWRCISGYGHAPEHMALYCADPSTAHFELLGLQRAQPGTGILIAGDMVLPRISTNVSVYEVEPEADALTWFLESIDKFVTLPEDTLIFPSHGKPFRGLHTRIKQLHDHHRDRLAEVMDACTKRPHTAADILPIMFTRQLDSHQITFAMGEALAHLHALWFKKDLHRRLDKDGVYRFYAPELHGVARSR